MKLNKNAYSFAAAFAFIAILVAGCSRNEVAAPQSPISCESPRDVIDLLASGLPTFDYNPADSLDALVDRVDLVIAGTLTSVQRVDADAPENDSLTELRVSNMQILSSTSDNLASAFSKDPVIEMGSRWAVRDEPDPIGTERTFTEEPHFVAFVRSKELRVGFHPDVQGLHIACDPDAALHPVLGELPTDAPSTYTELVNRISE